MKKNRNNLISKITLFSCVCLSAVLLCTACKTAPQVSYQTPDAFDVLDDEGAMYVSIPAKENGELLEKFITGFKLGVSENDAKAIVSKIDRIYASFGSRSDRNRICVSAQANVPAAVTGLLKKNGYEEKFVTCDTVNGKNSGYKYLSSESIEMAFPSSKNVLISKDVVPMIKNYAFEELVLNGMYDFEIPYKPDWKESDLYKWISEDTEAIHFYIVRPQSFLSNLLGSAVSTKTFKLNYAKGQFEKLPNTKYGLTLELSFQEPRYIKPAMALLSLALGLTDSETSQVNMNTVKLSGVHVSSKQLIEMFGL